MHQGPYRVNQDVQPADIFAPVVELTGTRKQWGHGGHPGNLPGGQHGILTPRFLEKKYFLVHRLVDSQQNH